jgi:hypothetical protein
MAITTSSNMKVYDPRTQVAFRERIGERIDLFNANSRGTITMTGGTKVGDLDLTAFFARPDDGVVRRDPTSTAAVDSIALSQRERATVKLNRRIGPYEATLDAFRKIGGEASEDAIAMAVGEAAAEYVLKEKLTVAIGSLSAAVRARNTLVHDISAGTGGAQFVSPTALNAANFKFGDANQDIIAYVMHSVPFGKLTEGQLTSTVSGIGNVVVYGDAPGSLGRPVFVTDNTSLFIPAVTTPGSEAPAKYVTLGLTAGACELEDTEQETILFDTALGRANITVIMQGEYAYNIGLKGLTWDVASGINPTNAALFTGTNWDSVVDSIKNLPGVAIISQ